jgi:two-component system CheB/CheR fusion protein
VQALLRFFENAPADMDMAFVVVLHLSPDHASSADQVLQHATGMPVHQVQQTIDVEKNHVYVISPSHDLALEDGRLLATEADRPHGRPVAIDLFFRSLADTHRERAIAIVLSGTGADGATGIGRIKEQGGVTIAQDPADAEYPEMPQNALATGMIDIALAAADMPRKLRELADNARAIRLPAADDEADTPAVQSPDPASVAERALLGILSTLRARTGHDFRHYKRATILRRIERRLQVNGIPDLPAYQDYVLTHPDETPALLKDMLIGVTNFFRDHETFEVARGSPAARPVKKPIRWRYCSPSMRTGAKTCRSSSLRPTSTSARLPSREPGSIRSRSARTCPRRACASSSRPSARIIASPSRFANGYCSPCTTCCATRRSRVSIWCRAAIC